MWLTYYILYYSQTPPQWPPWGQRSVAVVERWLLCNITSVFVGALQFLFLKYINKTENKQKLWPMMWVTDQIWWPFAKRKVLFYACSHAYRWEVILAVGMHYSSLWRGDRWREVKIRVNVWTFGCDKKVALVEKWLFVVVQLYLLLLWFVNWFKMTWLTSVFKARVFQALVWNLNYWMFSTDKEMFSANKNFQPIFSGIHGLMVKTVTSYM